MSLEASREFWIRRLEATGRAQARYLWLLLIAQLFYLALYSRRAVSQEITVPIIEIQLDAPTVLASGAPVIAFFVLTVMGAIRAWTHALEQVAGQSPVKNGEHFDAHPNAIDLALYTTARSPSPIKMAVSFVYPLFLSLALVQSAGLGLWLCNSPQVPWRAFFIAAFVATWLSAAYLVLWMLVRRVKQDRKSTLFLF